MVREYDRRRRLVVSGLNNLGLDCFEPKGAFMHSPASKHSPDIENSWDGSLKSRKWL
jgi:aminotransferase